MWLHPRGLVQPCLVALCKKSTRNQPISNPQSRRLVLRKPTAFQPLYIIAYSWNDGWFCKNQPRSNLRILKHMVGFTKTNCHPLVVLYKGRNAVGFLSIFCTNQPVGIGLVDSWTSPRGHHSPSACAANSHSSENVSSHSYRNVLLSTVSLICCHSESDANI